MGLDMNAYKTKAKFTKDTDFNDEIFGKTGDGEIDFEGLIVDTEEIAYWRKHPDLHGWMEQLYRKEGSWSGLQSSGCLYPLRLEEQGLR